MYLCSVDPNAVIQPIDVGLGPNGVAASHDSTKVYVANRFADSITIIDAVNDVALRTVPVGVQPFDVVVTADGEEAYVSGAPFSVVDIMPGLNSDVVSPLLQLSGSLFALTQNAATIYLTVAPNIVEVRDVATGGVQQTATVGNSPREIIIVEVPTSP